MQYAAYKPDSHICCDLVISTSTSVQLSSDIFTDNLAQSSFIGSMDVLVVCLDCELFQVSISHVSVN